MGDNVTVQPLPPWWMGWDWSLTVQCIPPYLSHVRALQGWLQWELLSSPRYAEWNYLHILHFGYLSKTHNFFCKVILGGYIIYSQKKSYKKRGWDTGKPFKVPSLNLLSVIPFRDPERKKWSVRAWCIPSTSQKMPAGCFRWAHHSPWNQNQNAWRGITISPVGSHAVSRAAKVRC